MTKLSKITNIFAASTIVAASILSSAAFAQETGSIPNSLASAEAEAAMGPMVKGSPITVTRIDALEDDEARRFENMSTDQLAAVQEELTFSPALTAELQAQGVKLSDVVDVQRFSNGGALVYVR